VVWEFEKEEETGPDQRKEAWGHFLLLLLLPLQSLPLLYLSLLALPTYPQSYPPLLLLLPTRRLPPQASDFPWPPSPRLLPAHLPDPQTPEMRRRWHQPTDVKTI
jgi:hypothetical protein